MAADCIYCDRLEMLETAAKHAVHMGKKHKLTITLELVEGGVLVVCKDFQHGPTTSQASMHTPWHELHNANLNLVVYTIDVVVASVLATHQNDQ